MKILVVSATPFELQPLKDWLTNNLTVSSPTRFTKDGLQIDWLVSGVGLPITAFSLGFVLGRQSYDLAIQAGIAGSFDREIAIGQVLEVVADRFADLGAEDQDGSFLDLNQLGLLEKESGIFTSSGQLLNAGSKSSVTGLQKVRALSVNKASGSQNSIDALVKLYPEAQIETMEGAAFFYACLANEVAMLQLRSISNYVAPRDRDSWDIPLAIRKLNEVMVALLGSFLTAASSKA